ncbi:MAG: isochorismatase [Sphingomonas sp. SCN 67-18]|uniref:isochorismatase family protein n=1 Tax=uncultured Sphingomonas sp. TaxID=158754 RepID=UPI00086D223D|nr:isochorismatase family protein [Sphingomonas sp. SCN 67-18]ODU22528.1 MAG: isochorismatase [Sphingomonas sp. SCN 67-18]
MAATDDPAFGRHAAAFHGRLPAGERPALLLIDMVEAYLQPDSPLYAGDGAHDALAAAGRLRDAACSTGAPVVFTNVRYSKGGVEGGLFYRKLPVLAAFEDGSPLGAFPQALTPAADDLVVTKHYASAFFGTALSSTLTALGVDTALVCGFSTSGCVRATALDALQHGFAPYVVRDACADRAKAPHEANLSDLQLKYGEVVDEAAAMAILRGTAAR